MRFQHPVTPSETSDSLASLCAEVSPGEKPLYIDVQPLPDAPINECFPLVEQHIELHGGEAVIGWSLWEMPHLFVEAEFHAVWKTPAGELLDIAPKTRPTARIFFLPDPSARYTGFQVNNVRRAIATDPDVVAYLRTFDEQFEFMNRGDRAALHGEVRLDGAAAREYQQIQARAMTAYSRISHRFPEYGPYGPCWCGSGKKMKWCHKQAA